MSTMNRRRFTLLGLGGVATATLVACGNEVGNEQAINPTMIPGVEGAPPTLVPGTPGAESEETPADSGGETGGAAFELHTLDTLKFDPAELTVPPGSIIRVINSGVLQHDFAIDDFGGEISPMLNGAETYDWTVPDQAGTYEYYCTVPGHKESGMHGTLTIDPAAAAPAGAEEASPVAEEGGEASGGDAPADSAAAGPIEVHMLDTLRYDPAEITAAPGTVLHFVNLSVLQHDFAIDAYGGEISPMMNKDDTFDWTIPGDATGSYEFYCTVPGHKDSGMVGTLTIG